MRHRAGRDRGRIRLGGIGRLVRIAIKRLERIIFRGIGVFALQCRIVEA